MSKFQYLNKRDDKGVMLRYSAHELACDASFKAIDLIKNRKAYNILISAMLKKFVDLYYMKMIYDEFLPIAHQLVIYRYDKKNHGKEPENSIEADGFPCQTLLKEIIKTSKIDLLHFDIGERKNEIENRPIPKEMLKNMLKSLLHTFMNQSNMINVSGTQNGCIGLNYFEGFDIRKRSNLCWFYDSGIDPSSVIVYYENPNMMTRHDDDQTAESFFHENGIRQVKLWEWRPSVVNKYFKHLDSKLKSFYPVDELDGWLKRSALSLCKRSSFWSSFFDYQDIKIHLDSDMSLDVIIKQIAIDKVGGCSIGKLRSYPAPTIDLGHYPNDVFFSWGSESAEGTHENQKHINNILVSGFPYKSTYKVKDNHSLNKNSIFESKETKFNILVLDSNHGPNDGLTQVIETSTMELFYNHFLEWIKNDKDIGLVIKPKKSYFINNLPKIIGQIHKVENETGRCELIRNSFQKMPNSYLKGIDMVVGTGFFFPSAVLECVIHGAKAIIYDYPNWKYQEKGLYKWGENKVVFPELSDMFETLKEYKNDPSSNQSLGDWSEYLDDIDPFRDGRGSERIGTYIRLIKEGFDKGLDRDETIGFANELYASEWGEDKVFIFN